VGLAVNDDRLTTRVGGVVVLLLGIAVALMIKVDDCHLRKGTRFEVYFEHLGALREGDQVQVAGKVIGEVKNVRLIPEGMANDPEHLLHGSGGVAVQVRIDARYAYMVPINGAYFISSKGLFGARYIEIGAPDNGAAPERNIRDGDKVRGIDPPRMDRVLQRSYENLMSTSLFVSAVFPEAGELRKQVERMAELLKEVEPSPGSYAALASNLSALIGEARGVRDKWDRAGISADDIRRLSRRARATLSAADRAFTDLSQRFDGLRGKLRQLRAKIPKGVRKRFELALKKTDQSMAKARRIVAKLRELSAMIDRGEGNIGALANDPEFSDDAKKLGKLLKSKPWLLIGHPQK
jgi:ABC-type transporter Mla subunit MlaD